MPDATPDPPAGDPDDSFEALFSRLEAITAQLEAGDLPLDRSVELYAEGMRIAERCQRMLADASQRVDRLREAYDEAAQNSLL